MNIKHEILFLSLLVVMFLGTGAALYAGLVHESGTQKISKSMFIENCTLNKGVAVLDLENNMRCVPMLGRK